MARHGARPGGRGQLDASPPVGRAGGAAVAVAGVAFDEEVRREPGNTDPEIHVGAAVVVAHVVALAVDDGDTGQHAGDGVAVDARGNTVHEIDPDCTAVRIVGFSGWRANPVFPNGQPGEPGGAAVCFATDTVRCGRTAAAVINGIPDQPDVVGAGIAGNENAVVRMLGSASHDVERAAPHRHLVLFKNMDAAAVRGERDVLDNATVAQPDDGDVARFRQVGIPDVQVAVGNEIAFLAEDRHRAAVLWRDGAAR
jgi:hypothetical protein